MPRPAIGHSVNPSNAQHEGAKPSSVSQILRRLGSEIIATADGEAVSRSEAMARYLWELAMTKEVHLATGEIIKATNGEWLEVVWRIIERLEGKPMQAISADVHTGLILNRAPRLSSKAFTNLTVNSIKDENVTAGGVILE